jgi:hypothetical protein
MNRFFLEPKLKPEFKLVQPLPVFLGVPATKRMPAWTPEAIALGLKSGDSPRLPLSLKPGSMEANRNVSA